MCSLICRARATCRAAGRRRRRRLSRFEANRIVAEINNGGEMVEAALRESDANLPVRNVTATGGKISARRAGRRRLRARRRLPCRRVREARGPALLSHPRLRRRRSPGFAPDWADAPARAVADLLGFDGGAQGTTAFWAEGDEGRVKCLSRIRRSACPHPNPSPASGRGASAPVAKPLRREPACGETQGGAQRRMRAGAVYPRSESRALSLSPLKLPRSHLVQRRAELAVECVRGELRVERFGLVGDRFGTLNVDARRALAGKIGLHVAFEPHAIARRSEDVGDPTRVAAARRSDAKRPRFARRRDGRGRRGDKQIGAAPTKALRRASGASPSPSGKPDPTRRRSPTRSRYASHGWRSGCGDWKTRKTRSGAAMHRSVRAVANVGPHLFRGESGARGEQCSCSLRVWSRAISRRSTSMASRVGATIQAHEVCDEINVGPIVAQTILQRQLYVRAHYVPVQAVVGILPARSDGIVDDQRRQSRIAPSPVRIVSIEEDEKGLLAVAAEELTAGVSTPVLYPRRPTSGIVLNRGVPPIPSTRR